MSLDRLNRYLATTQSDPIGVWREADLIAVSATPPPDIVFLRSETILRADAHILWFRWFMEGICNPLRYVGDETKTIIHVLADTKSRVDELYAGEPQDKRITLAKRLSQRIMAEVTRQRELARVGASLDQKRKLIDNAPSEPRCWVCGFRFSQKAIDRFLKNKTGIELERPEFVDILRPRGLNKRDIGIEVEHIVPVASGGGGEDNLALSCGWCNKSKGARTSIYDAGARAPRSTYDLGSQVWHELPHPFWTVRLLAIRGRCEHPSGCEATVKNAELFIAPSDHRGAPNPCNLQVFCADHDPYATDRFYGREIVRRIWDDRARVSV